MLTVGSPSKDLGDPQTLVERHACELLTVPRIGLPEASRLVSDGFDEAGHASR